MASGLPESFAAKVDSADVTGAVLPVFPRDDRCVPMPPEARPTMSAATTGQGDRTVRRDASNRWSAGGPWVPRPVSFLPAATAIASSRGHHDERSVSHLKQCFGRSWNRCPHTGHSIAPVSVATALLAGRNHEIRRGIDHRPCFPEAL